MDPAQLRDIWRLVASNLDMADFACLSSTCRALQGLDLPTMTVHLNGHNGVMPFLLRRWGSAKELKLHIEAFEPSWALNLPREAAALADLQALSVISSLGKDGIAWELVAWLAWVTAHCASLTFLKLAYTGLGSLPPLVTLRHLELWCLKFDDSMLASLQQVPRLETLKLAYGQSSMIPLPALQLISFLHLQHVSLYNLQLTKLGLPPGLHTPFWLLFEGVSLCKAFAGHESLFGGHSSQDPTVKA